MNGKKLDAPAVRNFGVDLMPDPLIDEQDDATYYGYAPLGTGEDEKGWLIKKVTKDGTVTKTEYADGVLDFVSAWSDRENLVYSR